MNLTAIMGKVILLTGATDGIGLMTAEKLVGLGHDVLIHGRSNEKLSKVAKKLGLPETATYCYDLSNPSNVADMAKNIKENRERIDVIINNAGVFTTPATRTKEGLDSRFAVNTIAPYILTQGLYSLLSKNPDSRVVNVSSAAQGSVNLDALKGLVPLSDNAAYAQSKLAIVQWSNCLASKNKKGPPMIVSVNPASFLGSKMVKQAYGMDGKDLSIGADIFVRAALADEFQHANGKYYDNDNKMFTSPHPDAMDPKKCQRTVDAIEEVLERLGV